MASWQSDQLKYTLGLGTLMSFYGIVSLIVYFAPTEKYGYNMTYKIVVIAVVLLTLPFALIIGLVVARRGKKKAEAKNKEEEAKTNDNSAAAGATPQKLATPGGNYNEITQAAEETVQFLKSSNVGGGKDAVYSLPWYIVAGTPKSGKSSLSLASGLNFQTLPSQRQSEQKFVRPTRNIDWRVTNDAVFLDTAGRYQTEGVDQEEWAAMLETVKKYRGTRPIDGFILAVNTERILNSDDKEIEETAKILRARIDETLQRVKVKFPIYLVFTHADAIEGFRDSFSTSRKEGENLVWGATIPLEKSDNAHALFDPEYDLLQTSVMKRRLMRLSAPFPAVRQIKIFNFPLHFGSARKKLGQFVSTLFRPNPFSENPFLRGFYFTAVPVNRPQMRGGAGQTMTNIPQTVGQSYFTEKLFRDVILRDKDLVTTFQAQKVSPPIMGWLLTFLGAVITFILLALAGYSLYQNKVMVDQAAQRGDAVLTLYKADKDRNVLDKTPDETREEIEKLEALRKSLVDLDSYERDGAPILMRLGFYSGSRIFHEKLLPIYFNAIEQRYKKPTVKRLEDDLRKFAAGNITPDPNKPNSQDEILGKNYDLLKAYLMLSGDPQYQPHAEPNSLIAALSDYWKSESKSSADMELTSQQQLDFYAKQVSREEFPRIKLDTNLVDTVRKKLEALPPYLRYYKRVTTEISRNVKATDLVTILGGRDQGALAGNPSVAGAYTIDGYRNYMKAAIENAQGKIREDDWVMGNGSKPAQSAEDNQDIQRLKDKYFNDYADNWQKFIHDVSVPQYTDKEAAANAMKAFSGADSPMTILLKEVAHQTNLSAQPPSNGWWDWIMSFFQKKQDTSTGGDTVVEKQFAPLFAFVKDDPAKPNQSQAALYGGDFADLGILLSGKSNDDIKKITDDFNRQSGEVFSKVNKADKDITNQIKPFEANDSSATAKEIAGLLRKPLNNLKDFFGAGEVAQLAKNWASQIFAVAPAIEKGYPFDTNGEADITKLTTYLNPVDGTLTVFYKQYLDKYFDGTPGSLKPKENSPVKFSDDFVKYINNAFRLRDTMFPDKGKTPKFSYSFTLQKVNNVIVEGTIDGQTINSTGTGSTTFTFPAASGDSGVSLTFTATDGITSTSGKTSPAANNSANSANTSVKPSSSPVRKFLETNSSGGIAPLKFPNTWGLFKFFDAGSPKKDSTGVYTLTYTLSNKAVLTINIKPTGGDLFDRTYFNTVHAPEKILK